MSAAPALVSGVFLPSRAEKSQSQGPSKFSTPAHPSVQLLERLYSEKKSGKEKGPTAALTPTEPPPYTQRDPHEQPTFTQESIVHPVEPILYLPPLLSSLPPDADTSTLSSSSSSSSLSLSSSSPIDLKPPPTVLTTTTRLPTIDPVSLSLHHALHYFRPVDAKYAARPYAEAFNWSELRLPEDEERGWYCVAFRSRRREGSNGDALYEADRKAHEEAVQNGGLLMYWYGVPDPQTGLNLATCIWQSRAHASAANSRPDHIRAMRLAKDAYEVYTLERHVLRKRRGGTGVVVEKFEDGEVGW